MKINKILLSLFILSQLGLLAACDPEPYVVEPTPVESTKCPNEYTEADVDELMSYDPNVIVTIAVKTGIGKCSMLYDQWVSGFNNKYVNSDIVLYEGCGKQKKAITRTKSPGKGETASKKEAVDALQAAIIMGKCFPNE